LCRDGYLFSIDLVFILIDPKGLNKENKGKEQGFLLTLLYYFLTLKNLTSKDSHFLLYWVRLFYNFSEVRREEVNGNGDREIGGEDF